MIDNNNFNILQAQAQFDTTVKEQRMKRLSFLLEKSGAYATILGKKLAKQQEEARERNAAPAPTTPTTPTPSSSAAAAPSPVETNTTTTKRGKGRPRKRKADATGYQLSDYLNEEVNMATKKKIRRVVRTTKTCRTQKKI